uniref:HAT C-terminal dimerisation domain-containing protein n=1 Tax=Plectus sambesii TaxID=2011161 RepID=A0A914WWY1_9BILA
MVESRTDGEEVNSYMSTFACAAPTAEIDVVAFWKIHQLKYPLLSSLALDLITILATSAAVERIFNQARLATAGRKSNTGPCLLESECLMKYNRRYVVRTKSC